MNRFLSFIPHNRSAIAAIGIVAVITTTGVAVPMFYAEAGWQCPAGGMCFATQPECQGVCPQCTGSDTGGCEVGTMTQPTKTDSLMSLIMGGVTGAIIAIGLGVWMALMYILNILMSAALFVSAYFLDNLFFYNVVLNPNNMPPVISGWILVRDVVNALFILIVLWVAITIIFDLDRYGGKRLLFKIIGVALLMNFSLAMVAAVFGFTNALAMPFRNAIAPSTTNLSDVIMRIAKINTATKVATNEDVDALKQALTTQKDCGLGGLSTAITQGCRNSAGAAAFADTAKDPEFIRGLNWASSFYKDVLALTFTTFAYFLLTITFLATTIMLLGRIIAMVFLAVLAPAALMSSLIPYGGSQRMFNRWLEALFCWAFFAPIFYFMLWLGISIFDAMAQNNTIQGTDVLDIIGNVLMMLPFFIFLAFVWTGMTLAKKLGCAGAREAISLGKSAAAVGLAVGAAVATGGASAIGSATLASGPATKALGAMRNVPVIGAATRPLRERQEKLKTQDRGNMEKRAKDLANYGPDYLASEYRSLKDADPKKKLPYAMALAQQNEFGKRLGYTEQQGAIALAQRYDMQQHLLPSAPHLATPQNVPGLPQNATSTDAIAKILKDVKEKWRIPESAYGRESPQRQQVAEAMVRVATPEDYNKIAQNNQELKSVLQEFINKKENTDRVQRSMNPQQWEDFVEYLSGTIARGLGPRIGYTLPEHLKKTV